MLVNVLASSGTSSEALTLLMGWLLIVFLLPIVAALTSGILSLAHRLPVSSLALATVSLRPVVSAVSIIPVVVPTVSIVVSIAIVSDTLAARLTFVLARASLAKWSSVASLLSSLLNGLLDLFANAGVIISVYLASRKRSLVAGLALVGR